MAGIIFVNTIKRGNCGNDRSNRVFKHRSKVGKVILEIFRTANRGWGRFEKGYM